MIKNSLIKTLLTVIFTVLLLSLTKHGSAQVIFSETFDEAVGATSGVDNSGNNINWTTSCPSCSGGDWLKVVYGKLEARDTNGPASMTSNAINTSSCSIIDISMTIEETGTMEACNTGCNSVDWVQLEYRIDGGAWQTPANSNFCGGNCANLDVIQSDDVSGGSMNYSTGCITSGGTLELRISFQCWSASEYWKIDDVQVNCSSSNPGTNGNITFCDSDPAVDLLNQLGGSPDNGGNWSGPSSLTNGDQGTYTPGTNTDGIYTYTIGPAGCQTSSQVTVTENTAPVIDNLNTTDPTCGSANGQIDITASGGTAPLQYSIDNGATFQAGNSFTGLNAGSYDIVVESPSGCQANSNVTLNNLLGPSIDNTDATDPTCSNNNGEIEVTISGGSAPIQFSNDNGASYQSSNIFNNLSAGSYDIIVEDDNGCQDATNITLNNLAKPSITNTVTVDPTCGNSDGSIDIMTSGGSAPLQYSVDNGATFQSSNTFNGLTAGAYDIVVEDDNGCQSTANSTLNNPTGLLISGTVDTDPSCGNNNGSIEINISGGIAPIQYSIDNGATFQASSTFSNLPDGTYNIIVKDDNACQSNTNVTLNADPIPTMNTQPDISVCVDEPFNGVDFSSVNSGTTFEWSILSGNDLGFGVSGSGDIASQPANSFSAGTSESIEVTPISPAGCYGTPQTFDLTIHTLPNIQFTANKISGCSPMEVHFTNNTNNSVQCNWDFGNGNQSSVCQNVSHTFTEGTYDISLTVQDNNTCTNQLVQQSMIDVFPVPIADFAWTPENPSVDNPEVAFTNHTAFAQTYRWIIEEDTIQTEDLNYTFPKEANTSFDVTLIASKNGCTDQKTSTLKVKEVIRFYVPNAFTPDGDRHNNTFKPVMTSGFDPYNYTLLVFNRWGEPVFESHNSQVGWDGRYRGEAAENGVYVWKIAFSPKFSDEKITKTGHVNLIR